MSKQEQIKTAPDAVEFLPDALEIQQERLPWYAHVGILWIALIITAVIAWSCVSKVDVIVRAKGKVVSDQGNIVMKPRESAVIKRVDVKIGDIVQEGDPLITFDPAFNQAEVERIQREIDVLTAESERYDAEFNGREYVPANNNQHGRLQSTIYTQRQTYYKEKIAYYDSNLQQVKAAQKSTKDSLQKYREILQNMSEIESMYKELRVQNTVSYKELLEVTMNRMQYEAQVSQLENQLLQYDQTFLSVTAERNAFVEEWRNSISEKLVELHRELDNDLKQKSKAENLLSYVNLTAPCHAVVLDIANFPVGSAVGEAEAVITLVPLDGMLEIEAEVRPQDISKVHPGSETRIKLTAFPFQRYGTLHGNIRLISGNTFVNQGAAAKTMDGTAGQTYYRVKTSAEGTLRNTKEDFALIPGMEAEVEIKSGKRRIIEYLVHPLIKGLDEAFREP